MKRIISFPDLFLKNNGREEAIFDFLKEPILQACSNILDIKIETKKENKFEFLKNFDEIHFFNLLNQTKNQSREFLKIIFYHKLPKLVEDYLSNALPEDSLFIFFEIAPSIKSILEKRNIYYINIKYSPLRFGRDIYLAIQSNNEKIQKAIDEFEVPKEQIRLEASFLRANLRRHRANLLEKNINTFELSNSLIFIPQYYNDLETLSENGNFFTLQDFHEELSELTNNKRLMVMADHLNAYQKDSALRYLTEIKRITQKKVEFCSQNTYQILTADENLELISINSPVCQEASWFNKKSTSLISQATNLKYISNKNYFINISFEEITAPIFWHSIICPENKKPIIERLKTIDRNYFRESLEEWGDYEKVVTWERDIHKKSFVRSGGFVHKEKINLLQKSIFNKTEKNDLGNLRPNSMQERIRSLKDTKIGQTAYLVGNGPSISEIDIEKVMRKDCFFFNKSFTLKDLGHTFTPKYYFLRDAIGLQRWIEEFANIDSEFKFVDSIGYRYLQKNRPDLLENQNILSLEINRGLGNFMYEGEHNFSLDPSVFLNCGMTSVLDAVQLAVYMGYSKILIAGVDLDYSLPYFYGENNVRPEIMLNAVTEKMSESFKVAKKLLEKKGIILAKITKSPNLEINYINDVEIKLS